MQGNSVEATQLDLETQCRPESHAGNSGFEPHRLPALEKPPPEGLVIWPRSVWERFPRQRLSSEGPGRSQSGVTPGGFYCFCFVFVQISMTVSSRVCLFQNVFQNAARPPHPPNPLLSYRPPEAPAQSDASALRAAASAECNQTSS